jgi:hypothetical protein
MDRVVKLLVNLVTGCFLMTPSLIGISVFSKKNIEGREMVEDTI